MAKIKMKNQQKISVEEAFNLFHASASAKGLTEKTLATYQQHFHAIAKRTDISADIGSFQQKQMNELIAKMQKEVNGFSKEEIERYMEVIRSAANLIIKFSKDGGFEHASGF